MQATVISVTHYKDRETRGVKKDECIVFHYKIGTEKGSQPQMAVFYPKKSGAGRELLSDDVGFLDTVELQLEPDPNNVSRNIVASVKLSESAMVAA